MERKYITLWAGHPTIKQLLTQAKVSGGFAQRQKRKPMAGEKLSDNNN